MTEAGVYAAAWRSPQFEHLMSLVVPGLLNKQVDGELATSKITVKIQRGKVKDAGRVADGTCPHPQKIGLTNWQHPEDRS